MYDCISTGKPSIMPFVCEDCEMDIVKQTKKPGKKKEKLDPPYLFYFILFSNIFIPVVLNN